VNNGNPFLGEDESSATITTTTTTMTNIEVVDISSNNIEVATESIRLVDEPELPTVGKSEDIATDQVTISATSTETSSTSTTIESKSQMYMI